MTLQQLLFMITAMAIATYWGKVIHKAARSRRVAGRSANFIPREKVGLFLRFIWIPTVVGWIAAPLLAMGNHGRWTGALYHYLPAHIAGAGVVVLALVLTFICWQRMGRAWRMGIDPTEKNPLVTSGPFSIVRHPIYALSILMMLGSVVCVGSPLIILLAMIHIPLLLWESMREERHLEGIYGEQYARYCRNVNRFIPGFAPRSAWPDEAAQEV